MKDFRFFARTDIRFGRGAVKALPELLAPYGKNVLLVYGGGSIKRTGLYQQIMELLKDFKVVELSGIAPNPKIESVREGAALCKAHHVDAVLAVGGGSCIDAAKVIAGAAYYEGDAWDLVVDNSKIKKVLPVVTVLTLAATGSEMNKNAVISDMSIHAKLGTSSMEFIPRASVLDPAYLFTLPAKQTAAGTADIMSHVYEQYFQQTDTAYMTDCFAEGILKTCIKYCPIALKEPENYEARANLMWASTMALNGLISAGKGGGFSCHPIEHELSAFYDVTHGEGLAILTPRWMEYILSERTLARFCKYARNVWGLEGTDSMELARAGIARTYQFFLDCGIPMTLPEIGIDDSKIKEMAKQATKNDRLLGSYVPLTTEDVERILEMCLNPSAI